MSRRGLLVVAVAIGLAAAGLFATAAYVVGGYGSVAIWAGASWVFLLTTIVALPALGERLARPMDPAHADGTAPDEPR